MVTSATFRGAVFCHQDLIHFWRSNIFNDLMTQKWWIYDEYMINIWRSMKIYRAMVLSCFIQIQWWIWWINHRSPVSDIFVQVRSPSLGKALGLTFRFSLQPSRWIASIGSRWSNLGWNSDESTEFCARIFQTQTFSCCLNCDSKFFLDCTCMTPGSLESGKRWWCWKSAVHQFLRIAGLQHTSTVHTKPPFRSG